MQASDVIKYRWEVAETRAYPFDLGDGKVQNASFCLIRTKNNQERIYKFNKFLGEGIEGWVYKVAPMEGRAKALKIVEGDTMPELWFLQKIYLTHFPQKTKGKLCGVELMTKWFIQGEQTLKFSPLYDFDLDHFLNSSMLTPQLAEKIIRQLTEGVASINSCQIAVVDIKPENILCRQKNGAWRFDLADFGICTKNLADGYSLAEQKRYVCFDFRLLKQRIFNKLINMVGESRFSESFLNSLHCSEIDTAKKFHEALIKMDSIFS